MGKVRRKSKLTCAGDLAKRKIEREILLVTLKSKNWSLTETAKTLEMGHPSSVLAAMTRYGLLKEYSRAKKNRKSNG